MKSTVKKAVVIIMAAGFFFTSFSAIKLHSGNAITKNMEKTGGVKIK